LLPQPPSTLNDLARHHRALSSELQAACAAVIRRGWFVLGTEGTEFESQFADYCGTRYAVGVANGTDALELALRAIGVEGGDHVALTANAGGYGTAALTAIGARTVYLDVDPATFTMDLTALASALAHGTIRAVIATHLYGRLAPMDEILSLGKQYDTPIIEDCAQAHGAAHRNRRAGSWGAAGCFSFYPTKNLGALGDAGAITTNDSDLADRIRQLRQYGWESKYNVTRSDGCNSRLDEMQAAVLRLQLPFLDRWNAARVAIAHQYRAQISHPDLILPDGFGPSHVAHLFVIRTPHRESLITHLTNKHVGYGVHYPLPDYRQPANKGRFPDFELEHTDLLCTQVLTLPCFPEMTEGEVAAVASTVNDWAV